MYERRQYNSLENISHFELPCSKTHKLKEDPTKPSVQHNILIITNIPGLFTSTIVDGRVDVWADGSLIPLVSAIFLLAKREVMITGRRGTTVAKTRSGTMAVVGLFGQKKEQDKKYSWGRMRFNNVARQLIF